LLFLRRTLSPALGLRIVAAQFVSQTFVKGDRVTLMTTSGGVVVTGVVESISLLYTTIRSDLFMPISIPNKVRH
jgi:small-conductance mechanosensitive channel